MAMTIFLVILGLCSVLLLGGLIFLVLSMSHKIKDPESLSNKIASSLQTATTSGLSESLKTLRDQHEALSKQNQASITGLLGPIRENIQSLSTSSQSLSKENASLKEQIIMMSKTHDILKNETTLLAQTLKGDVKAQGCWGERVLSSVLEHSGLNPDREFSLEHTVTVKGQSYRPDAVIFLPDNQSLIVDAKTSLGSYQTFISSDTGEEKKEALKSLVTSLEKHIKNLSEKEYHKADQLKTLDFIFAFIPIEGAFSLALQEKPDLLDFAWKKRVILTTPSSLMACMKTVALLWKQENYNKNAELIAKTAGNLCDKFASVIADFQKMKTQIDTVQKTHLEIQKKLTEGQGNITSKIERLQELGAKHTKDLPENWKS